MESVIPKGYDSNIPFILRYYQILPKYYFFSQSETNALICVMNMGTGKTSLAIFTFLEYINKFKKSQFIDETIDIKDNTFLSKLLIRRPNVFFIGSWNSCFACKSDLLNKAFNFYPNEVLVKLEKLLRSNNPMENEEGKRYRNYLLRESTKYIRFMGYQSLVNMCFPTLFQKLIQNPEVLLQQWKSGQLDIPKEILSEFSNSFVVVDEMQRLYSGSGINSYGITIMILHKHAKEYNIKFLFLTGTIINSVLAEITAIANIVSDSREFIEFDTWTDKQPISFDNTTSDMFKYTIKDSVKNDIFKLLYPKMFFYNPSSEVAGKEPVMKKFNNEDSLATNLKNALKTFIKDDSEEPMKMLQFPEKTNYPIECHIGNCVIDPKQMIVIKLKVEGVQAERYAEYLKSASVNEDDEDVVKTSIFPQDAGLPLKESDWVKNGIIKVGNVLMGSFLKLENIRKYSIIGYYTFKYVLENALKHEKTIIYHIKLNGFGLYQYAEILDYNGFVRYESSVKNNSICMNCGHLFKEHSLPIQERLKQKICGDFQPIVYSFLTGDVNQTERDDLVNNVYNSPQNKDGHIICVMFVSDVAYSGVSFLNTNNIFILSRIPNISKWRQIAARIMRNKSHSLIENKAAKIWTFTVYHENEPKISLGEKYYRLRIIYEADAVAFLNELSKKSVGNLILNAPESYQMSHVQKIRFQELLEIDLKKCLTNVVNEIFKKHSQVWILDNLIERIKSNSKSVSPLNMLNLSNDFIIKFIFTSSLHVFKYKNPIIGTNEIYVSKSLEIDDMDNYQTISYSQFQSISFEERNLKILVNSLYQSMNNYTKAKVIGEIIKLTYKKLHLLKDCDIFWNSNYDIHNEWYEDDDKKFFFNHIQKNRNLGKMAGIYYNDSIIKRSGERIPIKYSFVSLDGFKNKKYLYRITCFVSIMTSPFYLNAVIEPQVKKEVKDLRKVEKGLQCISIPVEDLLKEFPKLKQQPNKRDFCRDIISTICEYQYEHPNEKGCLSPFEK